MNINKKVQMIREEILEEARNKKEQLVEAEKRKWEKEYQDFRENLNNKVEDIEKSYQQTAERKREQIISRAILDRKKKKRAIVDNFIEDFLDRLVDSLKVKEESRYQEFLGKLVIKGVGLLEGNSFILVLSEQDKDYFQGLTEYLKEHLPDKEFKIQEGIETVNGGIIIKENNGKRQVEYTFRAFIEMYKEEIALDIQELVLSI